MQKINKLKPLFIFGDIPWPLLIPVPEDYECNRADIIFRFLTNEIEREDLPADLRDLSLDGLQAEYNRSFATINHLDLI